MSETPKVSTVTLVVGTLLSAGVGIASYFLPASSPVFVAFLLALVGVQASLTLDHRVKLAEVQTAIERGDAERTLRVRVAQLSKRDPTFQKKYYELRSELADLAVGKYRIRTLTSLYIDDIESIDRLTAGETLLSTCPVSPASLDDAMRQLTNSHYSASIAAHKAAASRGVSVTRIYLLKDRSYYAHRPLKKHLLELKSAGLEIRVIYRDQTIIEGEFDFLVFGENKVSVGVAEPGAGTVSGAIAYTDLATVRSYISEYAKLKMISTSPNEVL